MSLRNILLLLTAVVVAAGAVYFARAWLDSERAAIEAMRKPEKQEAATQFVLVAKKNLERGSFVKPADLRWQAWPEGTLAETYVVRGKSGKPDDFAGAVVRFPVTAGEPITGANVVKPGEKGFMAAALSPGMRAITIPVDVTSGVAGFVFPGDRVDLMLTHQFKPGKGRPRYVTETLMPEVRVIAIDQRIAAGKDGAKVAKTVTFEVSPKEAEMVTVARRIGPISLSLRSLADTPTVEELETMTGELGIAANDTYPEIRGRGFTWDREVSAILAAQAQQKSDRVLIIRGGKKPSRQMARVAAEDEEEDEEENAEETEDEEVLDEGDEASVRTDVPTPEMGAN